MHRWIVCVAAMLAPVAVGCSDHVDIENKSLDQSHAERALSNRGITLPAGYKFVSMTTVPPPGSGSASFDGVYDVAGNPSPVLVDDRPLTMSPTPCAQILPGDRPAGLDCSAVTATQVGSTPLQKVADTLVVVAATGLDGSSRVYLSVSGH